MSTTGHEEEPADVPEDRPLTPEEREAFRRAQAEAPSPRLDAISLLVAIQEQQRVKSPELAAKQARLLAILKAETPPPPPPVTAEPKVWAHDDPNRPETEEDGIRARAQQIGQWLHQSRQIQARRAGLTSAPDKEPPPEK